MPTTICSPQGNVLPCWGKYCKYTLSLRYRNPNWPARVTVRYVIVTMARVRQSRVKVWEVNRHGKCDKWDLLPFCWREKEQPREDEQTGRYSDELLSVSDEKSPANNLALHSDKCYSQLRTNTSTLSFISCKYLVINVKSSQPVPQTGVLL